MPISWPNPDAPSWPPPEISETWFSTSDLKTLIAILLEAGFTHAAPTPAETNAYFKKARCDHDHPVIGRMLVSPSGKRYPVAVCNDGTHRDVLVQFPPYYMGFGSRNFEFIG